MDLGEIEFLTARLVEDTELKESIKEVTVELDKKCRSMISVLSKIHATPTEKLPPLLDSVKPTLESLKEDTSKLALLVPQNQFWRWKDMWAKHFQSAVFVVALCTFLTTEDLATLPQVQEAIGISEEWKDRVALPAEDYLHGVITLVNELSRYAVNAVTMRDFDAPFRISSFLKDVAAGFALLNLKNDLLRRRFDSIKYDVKRVEEVVYDVTLRNLNTKTKTETSKSNPDDKVERSA